MTMPPLPTLVDVELRHHLSTRRAVAFVHWGIFRSQQLCHTRDGRAHLYVTEAMARAVLAGINDPPDCAVVQVVTADYARCAEIAL